MSTAAVEDSFTGPNLNITLTCPDCKTYPPQLIEAYASGDLICSQCGLVICDRIIDTRSEWRTFSNDDQNGGDPSRVGDASNPLLDGDQLQTLISFDKKDSRASRELNRAQSKSLVDKKDNQLAAAFSKISQMCETYALPKIVQDAAKEVYKLSYEEKPLKGKSQEAIMAAAIFIGCRKANVARTFKEIWVLTKVPKKEIGKTFKLIKKIIEEKGHSSNSTNPESIQTTQTTAEDLIRRFCSRLGLNNQVTNAAEYIARRVKELGVLGGRSPITITAAVIYMAATLFESDLNPTRISYSTGVSEGTIKTSYKLLAAKKKELIDPYWITSGKVKENATVKTEK
ncbi:transcription factor TFIIB [Saccharomycopsis crataegensis]|uniref:Transcription initiation factor IIB n=1 Tax=Saccharomycopsis crataegensis TaxID=43959 RepID=A0AAV5QRJ7_9ASCO|nr:transcription factor TFIIB [Saccharomycopsis crataegensis]